MKKNQIKKKKERITRSYLLHQETIQLIKELSEELKMQPSDIVEKSINLLKSSSYKSLVNSESTASDFDKKLKDLDDKINILSRLYFEAKIKDNLTLIFEYLKKRKSDGKNIGTKIAFKAVQKKLPDLFNSYEEYRLFFDLYKPEIKKFKISDPDKEDS